MINGRYFSGVFFVYAKHEYNVYADGTTTWHIGNPDPNGILDENLIKRVKAYRKKRMGKVNAKNKHKR